MHKLPFDAHTLEQQTILYVTRIKTVYTGQRCMLKLHRPALSNITNKPLVAHTVRTNKSVVEYSLSLPYMDTSLYFLTRSDKSAGLASDKSAGCASIGRRPLNRIVTLLCLYRRRRLCLSKNSLRPSIIVVQLRGGCSLRFLRYCRWLVRHCGFIYTHCNTHGIVYADGCRALYLLYYLYVSFVL